MSPFNHGVQLVGLDFGTTTTSAVVASAAVLRNTVTGKMELGHVEERYRSPLMFTPWRDDRLDVEAVDHVIAASLDAGGVRREDVFGGGALLTGLTAQADNAAALVAIVRRHLGEAFVATADDPCLESWLAFHGSCSALSRSLPQTPILNLDIGGGTTNAALGLAGEVLATGCWFIGARHVQVRPGSYEIARLSRYARSWLEQLGIKRDCGDRLTEAEVRAFVDAQLQWLVAMATGRRDQLASSAATLHEQAPLRLPTGLAPPIVALSGGVGELVYARLRGEEWPPTTAFGDLGIDLARRLLEASPWAEHFRLHAPTSCGRATVYGLLHHSTQASGSTVFLSPGIRLPMNDVPIFGRISRDSSDEHFDQVLDLVQRNSRGGGLAIELDAVDVEALRGFADRFARRLEALSFPPDRPLVLFVRCNAGKILGQLITRWGRLPLSLLVVDELDVRTAQYAHVGAPRAGVMPVSVFGLND